MSENEDKAKSIFLDAAEIASDAERDAYVAERCGGDGALRSEVEDLLRHRANISGFMPAAVRTAGDTPAQTDLPLREGPGTMIGPYKLLQQIGEGGMGVVFLAEQQRPVRRQVALKVIKTGMDTRQVVARFESERQALALMDHPNIAKVLDAGATQTGQPYFVMELVKGSPITKYCDTHHVEPRLRLELFVQVCQAVQHAHQKGIIHRDLKPSNVLVARYDGRPVPKIIDFGVAKATGQRLTERTMFTGFGDVIGTLEYMSPEQAEVNQLDVDTRSDVYSLGVLLYELLTGTTPLENKRIRTAALLEMLRVVREEEPPKPSTRLNTSESLPSIAANRGLEPKKLSGLVKGELDWIVMKALEKDRTRRYETANGLASDVQRYLNDEAVAACPPSAWYRFRKFARRHKRALASAAVLAVAALVGVTALAVSTVLVSRANKELSASVVRERRAADGERLEAYFQRITVAHRELSIDNLAAALRALGECPEVLRGWEWDYLARLCKVDPLIILDNTPVNGVAFSPDGDRLASGGGDGDLKVRDSRTGNVIRILEKAHAGSVLSVAFHCDGKHLASRGADQKVKVWDWTTGEEVFSFPCDAIRKFGSAYTVAFSPDGRQLAAGSDGAVSVWDWKNRQLLHTFAGHERNAISVAYSLDGRRLASACTGEGVKIWDTQSGGVPLRTIGGQRHPLSALAFSPDGRQLASASLDHTLKLWDTNTGERLCTLLHTGNVECVAFSPDGHLLASAGEDKTVRLWDPKTGRAVLGLRGHTGRCGCVVFSPDGRRLVSASIDGTIHVWDATKLRADERQEAFTFEAHDEDEIRSVVVSRDGRKVAAAGQGRLVRVWDAATRQTLAEFDGHTNVVFGLAWHPDGERIAAAGWDGRLHTAHVWDVPNRAKIFTIPPGQENFTVAYYAVAFSPDGRYLVMGEGSGALQVWDAWTGQAVGTLGTHSREIRGVVFSRDGRHLASASSDGEVRLWDATRLNAKQEPRLPSLAARVPGPSLNVDFSPDGERLATGGDGNTIKIWDVQTGKLLRTIAAHGRDLYGGDVYAVAFSPDKEGRWIASGSEDSTVKIWDSRSGEMVRSFRGHTGLVSCLAFSPDGKRLYSGSRDTTVKVWDVSSLDRAGSAAGGR